ncbi:MAG TPA: hemerythrin domain-containing protein [Dehalococcoidia bacterium]|nr:hemerythrin domain-containing protein [Dehalococcoidia bacterium]
MLMTEHRLIERVLDSLLLCANELSAGAAVERGDLARFTEFIQEFADRGHHAKEEQVLFDVMASCGFPLGGGPLAVMLAEHDEGRQMTGVIVASAQATGGWSPPEVGELVHTAGALRGHLRQHILKEDQILYPMAMNALPAEAMAEVAERCEAFQSAWEASGEAGRLLSLGKALHSRWGGEDEKAGFVAPRGDAGEDSDT